MTSSGADAAPPDAAAPPDVVALPDAAPPVDAAVGADSASATDAAVPIATECDHWRTAHPEWIACADFESGDFSQWSGYTTSALGHVNVDTVRPHSGRYAADIFYSNPASNDIILFFYQTLDHDHVFVRGYVYFQHPEPGGSLYGQRKIFYFKQSPAASDQFISVLSSDYVGYAPHANVIHLRVDYELTTGPDRVASATGSGAGLAFDRWYSIEEEIQLNTPGASDGFINVWIDGVLDPGLSPHNINIRGSYTANWGIVEIGRQLDPCDMTAMYSCTRSTDGSEHRFWDDVVVSRSFVTP